jgi:FkbM family methyltransferase
VRQFLVSFAKSLLSLFGIRLVRIDHSKERVIPRHLDLDLMFDVGANTGQYVRLIREQGFKNQVVSFEPLSNEHRQLQLIASKDKKWHIYDRCAIGNTPQTANMNISQNSFSSSLSEILQSHLDAAPESRYIGTESVEIHRLSQIYEMNFNEYKRIGLKVDVQGFEMEVLLSAQEILNSIEFIQVELSLIPVYENQSLYFEIDDFLRKADFKLWKIIPGFTNPGSGQQLQFDAIYIKQECG